MLLGSLRGNVLLGIGLHYTRLFVCLAVFPRLPADDATIYAVLLAWSLTEVARYPFYIAPSPATSALRYACPVLTFPVGAGAEAYACYLLLPPLEAEAAAPAALRWAAMAQIGVNSLGGLWAYPPMVRKAAAALSKLSGAPPDKPKAQ